MSRSPRNPFPILLSLALLAGCWGEPATSTKAPPEQPTAAKVAVEIDYGGETENRTLELPYAADTTLLELMRGTSDLALEIDGEGTNARIRSIDGVRDEGAGEMNRNWQYWVNDAYATTGVGSHVVEPGDEITWKFTTFEEAKQHE